MLNNRDYVVIAAIGALLTLCAIFSISGVITVPYPGIIYPIFLLCLDMVVFGILIGMYAAYVIVVPPQEKAAKNGGTKRKLGFAMDSIVEIPAVVQKEKDGKNGS